MNYDDFYVVVVFRVFSCKCVEYEDDVGKCFILLRKYYKGIKFNYLKGN